MFKLCLVLLLCYSSFALVMYDTRFGNESIAQSVVNAMNTSVDPCEDFYEYACGSWLKNTTIPEDAARYSRSFDVINKKNFAILRDILENDHSIDSSLRKFFGSCMDMHNIEVEGTSVLDTYLSFIDSMVENPATGSWNNAWKLIGFMHSIRMYPLFEFHVEIDAKIPTQYLATFGQSGITLPDRNFYLDPNLSGLRDQYKAHMVRMFTMLNMTNPSGRADSILQFETSLATIFVPGADLRDPFKVYNKMGLNELRDTAPGVNWDNYLKGATLESTSTFNLIAPQYMQKLSDLVAQVSLEQVGFYLKWVFIHEVADYLPARFVNETFSFFGKVLLGEDEMPIRTTTCIESTDESMGFLLSQYFVQRAFPGASKTMASNLIHAIEDVFSTTLKGDDWMDETTRQRALTKLSLVKDMIGYPDVWPIYSFSVTDSYIRNKMAARLDAFSKQKDKLGKPVSHDEWEMTPATVNAYYEPTMNVMVFPAAILQNPFFDLQFPIPMNFGGIGMVMGHELSHGFDDQGRLYDGYGKLENWWTPTVNENFKVKATCLVNQYSAYQPLPGYHVNGNLTLGENIADNAGIKDAYKALEATLGPDALNAPSIVSFLTNAKLFFVSYAQTWCSKARDEFIKQRLLTDVHSPAKFRVIGPLSNLKQFASTFNCKVGSAMNPTNKCELF